MGNFSLTGSLNSGSYSQVFTVPSLFIGYELPICRINLHFPFRFEQTGFCYNIIGGRAMVKRYIFLLKASHLPISVLNQ